MWNPAAHKLIELFLLLCLKINCCSVFLKLVEDLLHLLIISPVHGKMRAGADHSDLSSVPGIRSAEFCHFQRKELAHRQRQNAELLSAQCVFNLSVRCSEVFGRVFVDDIEIHVP